MRAFIIALCVGVVVMAFQSVASAQCGSQRQAAAVATPPTVSFQQPSTQPQRTVQSTPAGGGLTSALVMGDQPCEACRKNGNTLLAQFTPRQTATMSPSFSQVAKR